MSNTATGQEQEIASITRDALEHQLQTMREQLRELTNSRLQLETEQAALRKLLDAAPDALLFVDRQGKILRVNAQMEHLFGYGEGKLDGQNILALIPDRFHDKHRRYLWEYFAHPRQRPMGSQLEIYGRRKDGGEFPADISLNFLKIGDDLYASASIRDITERKAIDEKLVRDVHIQRVISEVLKTALKPIPQQEQLDTILELILSVPMLFLEQKGAVYVVKEDRSGMSLAALRGFDQGEELPCQDIIFGLCLCGEAAATCKTVYADQLDDRHRLIRDDMFSHGHYCVPIIENGECVGLLNLYVKEGHKRNGIEEKFITVIADTTALVIRHHRNEKERSSLRDQLAVEEKMAALGRMAENFAHQIRNPLTTLGGLARRLTGLELEARAMKYAASINSEAARLELLLNNMFTYVRPPTPNLKKQNLTALVDEVVKGFSPMIRERSVTMRKQFQQVPELLIDRLLISLALKNLLINALEAMPEGGTLTLAVVRNQDDGKVSIEVRDSGPGIPASVMETIFEPFTTTKVGEKKVGLGLTIAKKIAESHQGGIEISSTQGKGTTAILTLPMPVE